jgi:hypothetical protein
MAADDGRSSVLVVDRHMFLHGAPDAVIETGRTQVQRVVEYRPYAAGSGK